VKEILKPLFDNPIYNYAAMAIVAFLAFQIAWSIVGSLYANDLIRGRTVGSIIHWSVRFIAFVIIITVISVIIWLVKFILLIPVWIWFALLGILVIVGIIYKHFLTKRLVNKNKTRNQSY